MKPKKIKLISFRRSGAHLLLETIKRNFNYPIIKDTFHPGFDLHTSSILRTNFNIIYIYRDVRDVMKSLYNFFLFSNWRVWSGFNADFTDISFSDFLWGKTKIIKVHCPHFRMILEDPIGAWVEHTLWLEPLNKHDVKGSPFSIKYESLVNDPVPQINILSSYLNCQISGQEPYIITDKLAQTNKKLIVEYTKEDMTLLLDKAGKRLLELGYII